MEEIIEQLKDKISGKEVNTIEELIEEITNTQEFEIISDWSIVLLLEKFDNYSFVKEKVGLMKDEVIRRAKSCYGNNRETSCRRGWTGFGQEQGSD